MNFFSDYNLTVKDWFSFVSQKKKLVIFSSLGLLIFIGLVLFFMLAKSKLPSTETPSTKTSTLSGKKATSSASKQKKTYPVKVFFSKHPQSDDDPGKVFPVVREAPDLGVARFSLEELIKGPNKKESELGYFTELKLIGASSCGADFTLSLQSGKALVTFCRSFSLPGDLSGGRIDAQIQTTLKQFSSVTKVVILSKDGHCAFDLSGEDLCKK